MDDHPDERASGEQRIYVAEGPFADSGLDIRGEVVVKNAVVLAEEHLGQFVAFERAKEQKSQEGGVHTGSDAEASDQGKDSTVIALSRRFLNRSEQLVDRDLFGQNGAVQGSLGREMLEHERFADAGGSGDLFGRCAVEAFGGEEGCRCGNQAGLTLLTRRSGSSCHGIKAVSE